MFKMGFFYIEHFEGGTDYNCYNCFQDGKDIENSGGDKLGNSIVIHPNPGKSSYVLKQTSNIF